MARVRKTVPHGEGSYPHREHRSKKNRRKVEQFGKNSLYKRKKQKLKEQDYDQDLS